MTLFYQKLDSQPNQERVNVYTVDHDIHGSWLHTIKNINLQELNGTDLGGAIMHENIESIYRLTLFVDFFGKATFGSIWR